MRAGPGQLYMHMQPLTDAIAERDIVVEPPHNKLALQAYAIEGPGCHRQGHEGGQEQLLHKLEQQVGDDVVQPVIALTGEEVALCSQAQGEGEGGRGWAGSKPGRGRGWYTKDIHTPRRRENLTPSNLHSKPQNPVLMSIRPSCVRGVMSS